MRPALERHNNVQIQNKNVGLDKQLFDATFDIETIEEFLESFNKGHAVDYYIKNNKVIISENTGANERTIALL